MTVPPTIQIAHVPDCPLVDKLLWLVEECLAEWGARWPIELIVTECASPTLLIDGVDGITGRPVELGTPSCRVVLPLRAQILSALQSASLAGEATRVRDPKARHVAEPCPSTDD